MAYSLQPATMREKIWLQRQSGITAALGGIFTTLRISYLQTDYGCGRSREFKPKICSPNYGVFNGPVYIPRLRDVIRLGKTSQIVNLHAGRNRPRMVN